MSLLQDSQIENSIYICTFQCTIRQANIFMKFPCSYFVEWSTSNGKSVAMTSKHLPQKNIVHFDQKIILTTEMLFNNSSLQFSRKETLVQLYLVSKSRPDQNKLVGRVTIDLAKIVNFEMYAQPTEFKLNFCSVQGSLILQFQLTNQKLTTMKVQDLDKSSFIDFISQIAFKPSKNQIGSKNSLSLSKQKLSLTQGKDSVINNEETIRRSNPGEYKVVSPLSKGDQKLYFSNRAQKEKNIVSSYDKFEQRNKINQIDRIQEIPDSLNKKSQGYNTQQDIQKQLPLKKSQNLSSKIDQEPKNNIILDNNQLKTSIQSYKQKLFIEIPNDNASIQVVQLKNSSDLKDILIQQEVPIQERIPQIKATSSIDDKTKALELQANNFIQSKLANINFDRQFQNLRKENQNKSKTIYILTNQKQELQAMLTQMESKATILSEMTQSLKQELHHKNEAIRQLDKQLNERQDKNQALQRNLQTLKQQYLLKQSLDEDAQTNTNNLQNRLSLYEGQINDLNKALKQFQGKQLMYQQKFMNLQHMIKNLEDSNQNYHNKVKEEEVNKLSLNQKLKAIEKQKEELNRSAIQYKEKLSIIQQNELKWRHEEILLNEKLEEKQSEINRLHTQYLNIQSQLSNLMLQKTQLSNSYEEVLKMYNNTQSQCQDLKKKIQETLNNQSSTPKQIKPITNQHEIQLMDENNRLNQQIQFLKASLQVLEKQSSEQYEKINVENLKIKEINEKILKQNGELRKQNNKLRQDIKELQKSLSSLKLQTAKRQLNQKKKAQELIEKNTNNNLSQNLHINNQLAEYQTKLDILSQQNNMLKQKIEQLTLSNAPIALSPVKSEESWQERKQQYQMRISGLNSNLQQQINQNNQLSETILKYMEKQAKMKQTLTVLQDQSKEIFVLFQQKEHNEQTYQKMIEDLQKEIERLKTKFYQINEESPSKNLSNSPTSSFQKLKQKLQNSHDNLVDSNTQLQQLNDQLNEELIKLKLKYNELKNQSEAQIQKLNEQIIEANTNMKKSNIISKNIDVDKSLRNKDVELQTLRSHCKNLQDTKSKLEKQASNLRQQLEYLQQQKFGLQSDNNEKDIKILQMEQEIQNLLNQIQNKKYFPVQPMSGTNKTQKHSSQLQQTLLQLKQKLMSKVISADWQLLIQNILDKSLGGEQVVKLINMQQKCRLLSKQLQKLKSQVMKSGYKNQQQKLTLMNLIKPCQFIVTELIAAAQSLNLNQSSFL